VVPYYQQPLVKVSLSTKKTAVEISHREVNFNKENREGGECRERGREQGRRERERGLSASGAVLNNFYSRLANSASSLRSSRRYFVGTRAYNVGLAPRVTAVYVY